MSSPTQKFETFLLPSTLYQMDDNRMDSIHSLPNELICCIASLLSANEAAFALVLSKRWSNLFTIIPNLHFSDLVENPGDFSDFVDRLVALPPSSRIRKFTLQKRRPLVEIDHVDRCLCNVLKRGVLDLELDIDVGKRFPLPFEVFTCKTLVVLKLRTDLDIDFLPGNALLPALKNLILDSVRFYDLCGCAFQTLLSACPVLEDLVILGVNWKLWKWSRTVSSPTLQRLTITRTKDSGDDWPDSRSITFDTPKLVYLEYCDFVMDDYPTVNLDSLVEAKLDLVLTVDVWYRAISNLLIPINHPKYLFMGLKNVEILTILSPETFQVLHFFSDAIPMFENLRRLSIAPNKDDDGYRMRFLPFLLMKAPNLETLECSLHYDRNRPESVCERMSGYSCLLSCPVKVLEITEYDGTKGELEQMKHFLGNLTCLELVKIRAGTRSDTDKLRLAMDLLMFPRASVNCKIDVSE